MAGIKGRNGLNREDLRDRLRALGLKARQDARALTLADLDDICTLVITLAPTHFILPEPNAEVPIDATFEPAAPVTPHLEVQALLRQAHAMESIAERLGELVRLKEEEIVRDRWRPLAKSRDA